MLKQIPPITRALLLINVGIYLLQIVMRGVGIDLTDLLGLHFVLAPDFNPLQLISYMFLHGSFTHLFFNMFSLWMFGTAVEQALQRNRFLTLYFVSGIGAALCQELWQLTDYYLVSGLNAYEGVALPDGTRMAMDAFLNTWTTIGASGACYGVLLGFGMLFPDQRIMLLIPPIPLKAKYFVIGYAAIELISAYCSNDNVAHLAHLGGMLFAFFLLRYWRRKAQQSRNAWQGWDNYQSDMHRRTLWERIKGIFGRKTTTAGNARRTATRQTDYEENMNDHAAEQRMDEILDKIKRSGYANLTEEEKRELFRISRR